MTPATLDLVPRRAALVLTVGLLACTYYDSSLLASTGEVSPPGEGGAGGEGGASGGEGGTGHVSFPPGAGQAGAGGAAAGAGGAAAGQGSGGGETRLVGCTVKPIGPPEKPPAKKDGVEIVLAARSVDLGESIKDGEAAYKRYGFDLDGYCTCPADPSCKGSDPDKNRYCDGPDGRDNAGGVLIADFSKLVPDFSSTSINASFSGGNNTLMFRLAKYNGEADDDQVELSWLLGDTMPNKQKPVWDGNDVWPIQEASYVDPNAAEPVAKFIDKNAYVRGHVLVATLPGGSLKTNALSIELTGPVMVATLVPPDAKLNQWRIDSGNVAARWTTKNILAQLSRLDDPLSKQPLCTDNPFYAGIKAQLCAYADIPSGVQAQPNIPCDALSLGFKFTAVMAKIGPMVEFTPGPGKCKPGADPGEDSCN